MVRLFRDDETEARITQELSQRRQQFQLQRAQVTQAEVAALAAAHRRYPHAKPGVKYAIGATGLPVDSPVAREIADTSARLAAEQGATVQPGDTVDAAWFSGLKDVVRSSLTVLAAPFEELSAGISSIGEAALDDDPGFVGDAWENYTQNAAPSSLRMALSAGARGDVSDQNLLGQGFLPGGPIGEFREQAKQRLKLDGQFVTPGRLATKLGVPLAMMPGLAAFNIDEPGSRGYNTVSGLLDFALNVYGDPANIAGSAASKAVKAARTFNSPEDVAAFLPEVQRGLKAALVDGPRKGVLAEEAEYTLVGTRGGKRLVEWITGDASPHSIWKNSGGKFDVETSVALAKADTPEVVVDVLRGVLGVKVGQKLSAPRLPNVRKSTRNIRFLQEAPGNAFNVDDLDEAVAQADAYWRNAKLPEETIASLNDELMQIDPLSNDRVSQVWNVAKRGMVEVNKSLEARGVEPGKAQKLAKLVEDFATEFRAYGEDEVGRPIDFPGAKRTVWNDGTEEVEPTAMLLTHHTRQAVSLPDPRVLRSQISAWKPVLDVPGVQFSLGIAAEILNPAWKTLQLARLALPMRVLPEEQIRMAASDLASAFKHPLSYIAYLTGKKGAVDVTGNPWAEGQQFIDAMSRGSQWASENAPGTIATGDFRAFKRGEDGFLQAWAGRLGQIANDPVAQRVAGGLRDTDTFDRSLNGLAAAKDWFFNGNGREFLEQLNRSRKGALSDKASADAYIDSVWSFINAQTGGTADLTRLGNADLIGGLARGRILDVDVFETEYNPDEIATVLREMAQHSPQRVHGPRQLTLSGREGARSELWDRYDKATSAIFDVLLSKPTNKLSRSQTFKQLYYRELERLIPFMDSETQKAAIIGAGNAKLGSGTVKRLRELAGKGASGQIANLDQADLIAKDVALRGTKELLYDLSKRSQFADINRLIAPFAEPWKEILTTWTRLAVTSPRILRRADQIVRGARNADPDQDGKGFFYVDDNGEEAFAYPGGHLFTRMIAGGDSPARVDLVGKVSGLNLIGTSVIPGFGPVVQIPASKLIPQTQTWDGLVETILPYGREDTSRGVIASQLPAWMQRFKTAFFDSPENNRVLSNTVVDVMRTLALSGEYNDENGGISGAGKIRLEREALKRARLLYTVRGAAQFVAPTGPQATFSVDTPEGLFTFSALAEEYRKMQLDEAAGGYDTAFDRFVARFGSDLTPILQGKSVEVRKSSVSKKGADWLRSNSDVVERFPNTAGYFAPEGVKDFDYTAYQRDLDTGARDSLTPDEVLTLHNNVIGYAIYNRAKEQAGDSVNEPGVRAWLAELRTALREEYPGFQATENIGRKVPIDVRIGELQQAATDPKLARTDAGKGLVAYLRGRQQALEVLAGQELSTLDSKTAAPQSAWLRELGEAVVDEHPGFSTMWAEVFSRELYDPADDDALALTGG